jgi:hypothetical protein
MSSVETELPFDARCMRIGDSVVLPRSVVDRLVVKLGGVDTAGAQTDGIELLDEDESACPRAGSWKLLWFRDE